MSPPATDLRSKTPPHPLALVDPNSPTTKPKDPNRPPVSPVPEKPKKAQFEDQSNEAHEPPKVFTATFRESKYFFITTSSPENRCINWSMETAQPRQNKSTKSYNSSRDEGRCI